VGSQRDGLPKNRRLEQAAPPALAFHTAAQDGIAELPGHGRGGLTLMIGRMGEGIPRAVQDELALIVTPLFALLKRAKRR
jgi:hypothetical protein